MTASLIDRTSTAPSRCPHPEIARIVEQYGEATCPECGQVGTGMVIGALPPRESPVPWWIITPWPVLVARWLRRRR